MTPELQKEVDAQYAVQIQNVTKDFGGGVRGLDNVKIGFRTGEITVLLGLSGSGKSTLLRHINGLHTPTKGSVRVLSQEVNSLNKRELRSYARTSGSSSSLSTSLARCRCSKTSAPAHSASSRARAVSLMMYPKAIKQEALQTLERVGLAAQAHQRADTLSGGQQQRVAIARALMQHPKVLLADEPVAALDPVSSASVIELLEQICREDGLTVISSLHQVQLAVDFADRIIGLQSGKVGFDRSTEGMTAESANEIYQSVAVAPAAPTASAAAEA
ncbi:Phosphonates import ATP-binding protein PhnC [Corynebacterium camporealensis]|uniref:phosphonate ABC transporter ATP-binding protein n=1 Tax=Corynebacterium camporealensis TaxID=161896 RepID=UPI000CF9384D|nr:ATP-binding cassette domain-containing protein [Corynebacterium camporealensis]AVH87874.1 Phosphonates import ATP-binding protein PhnC [Corynebacterium camporealensis]